MKFKLISDIINIVIPNGDVENVKTFNKHPAPEALGNFDVLYNEELAFNECSEEEFKKIKQKGGIVPIFSKNMKDLNKAKQASTWK
jgi:hypothetical protein